MSGLPETPLLLLLSPQSSDVVEELDLPDKGDNLFQRIIRNPRAETSNPRERECTEMLCAVLRNTIALRLQLLGWMADSCGLDSRKFQDMTFVIETEGSIGAKRDDLRIEGWLGADDERQRVLLLTVEVKVGATFHESSPLDDGQMADEEIGLVNQIVNYDHWLDHQAVPSRAGFVLALGDMTDSLPDNLNCRWQCLSWTGLGLKIQEILRKTTLPGDEVFLAKHLLGFIVDHLWRVSEMTDFEINFDDVALMRAHAVLARDSEDKINRLVESLISMVDESDIGEGAVTHQKSLYKGLKRSVVYRRLFAHDQDTNPMLMAGCTLTHMAIWLETPPSNQNKNIVGSVIRSLLPQLQERNPGWGVNDEQGWWDLEITKPLTSLLSEEDQAAAFEAFFKTALQDLCEVRVRERLREKLDSEGTAQV